VLAIVGADVAGWIGKHGDNRTDLWILRWKVQIVIAYCADAFVQHNA
jgi:hypothetical protein